MGLVGASGGWCGADWPFHTGEMVGLRPAVAEIVVLAQSASIVERVGSV